MMMYAWSTRTFQWTSVCKASTSFSFSKIWGSSKARQCRKELWRIFLQRETTRVFLKALVFHWKLPVRLVLASWACRMTYCNCLRTYKHHLSINAVSSNMLRKKAFHADRLVVASCTQHRMTKLRHLRSRRATENQTTPSSIIPSAPRRWRWRK